MDWAFSVSLQRKDLFCFPFGQLSLRSFEVNGFHWRSILLGRRIRGRTQSGKDEGILRRASQLSRSSRWSRHPAVESWGEKSTAVSSQRPAIRHKVDAHGHMDITDANQIDFGVHKRYKLIWLRQRLTHSNKWQNMKNIYAIERRCNHQHNVISVGDKLYSRRIIMNFTIELLDIWWSDLYNGQHWMRYLPFRINIWKWNSFIKAFCFLQKSCIAIVIFDLKRSSFSLLNVYAFAENISYVDPCRIGLLFLVVIDRRVKVDAVFRSS